MELWPPRLTTSHFELTSSLIIIKNEDKDFLSIEESTKRKHDLKWVEKAVLFTLKLQMESENQS